MGADRKGGGIKKKLREISLHFCSPFYDILAEGWIFLFDSLDSDRKNVSPSGRLLTVMKLWGIFLVIRVS